jgi:hypothetical protein
MFLLLFNPSSHQSTGTIHLQAENTACLHERRESQASLVGGHKKALICREGKKRQAKALQQQASEAVKCNRIHHILYENMDIGQAQSFDERDQARQAQTI